MSDTPKKLAEANADASDDGVEWGQYVERKDGNAWIPLIYTADGDRQLAESWVGRAQDDRVFRNRRLVRRVVGDWKVVDR